MPVFPNPAGGEMVVANRAEAEARGWTPSMGTFGARSEGGGGGGGGGAVVPQNAGNGPTAAQAQFFGNQGLMTQKELDERKRQFDANLAWTKQMWEQQGLPQLVIQQKAAQLQQDEFNFQAEQARRQQSLAEVTQLGGLGLQQQQAALDAIKTAATMGGPESWVQLSNLSRGVSQSDIPVFMRNLLTGTGAPAATIGAGVPTPRTFAGTAAQLSGGATPAGTGSDDLARTLAMGSRIFGQGGAALGPQALEGLSDDEMKMLGSVGSAVGASIPTFMKQYAASRIGQGAAQAS